MSRSRKKSPYGSITVRGCRAGQEAEYKTSAHRRLRRAVKSILRSMDAEAEVPEDREFGNPWWGPKDGKCYYGNNPKWLRK